MYANQITFTLGAGKRSVAEGLVSKFAPALAAQKGFERVTFLADDGAGEYGALVVFESREDADATFAAVFPQLEQALAGVVQGEPRRQLFEVLEPES